MVRNINSCKITICACGYGLSKAYVLKTQLLHMILGLSFKNPQQQNTLLGRPKTFHAEKGTKTQKPN